MNDLEERKKNKLFAPNTSLNVKLFLTYTDYMEGKKILPKFRL